jgi:exopolysaccharide production protein ExoQ
MLKKICQLIEVSFAFFAISVFANAYVGVPSRLSGATVDLGMSDPYSSAANAIILSGLIVLCSIRWRRFFLVVANGPLVNLFLAFAFASALWSFDPDTTLRRSLTLLTTFCLGYWLVARFSLDRIIRLVASVCIVAGVASAVVAVAIPRIGVMSDTGLAGDWCGVFNHKNSLGAAMMLGCLCCGWSVAVHRQGRAFNIFGLLICFGVSLMSGSRTSVMMILFMPFIGYCLRSLRLPGLLRIWTIFLLVISAGVLAVLIDNYFVDVMVFLDKDPSLTGRAPLWNALLGIIAARPVIGYGFGAFWLEGNINVEYLWKVAGWIAPTAHNSYLDMLLQLGIVGLPLSMAILGSTLFRAARAVWSESVSWASFAGIYVITLFGAGFFETNLLNPGELDSVMLVSLYASLRLADAHKRSSLAETRVSPKGIAGAKPATVLVTSPRTGAPGYSP